MSTFAPAALDTAALAAELDRQDPLSHLRERFVIPEGVSYLCGNCLGLQPKATADHLREVMDGWAAMGFRAHFNQPHHWMSYDEQHLIGPMAGLIGALPSETALMNSLSVNLHLMMASFYRPEPWRYKILVEEGAFPSDQFVVDSQLRLRGLRRDDALIQVRRDEFTGLLDTQALLDTIERQGQEIALILLGNTSFRNGQVLDTEAITRAGHAQGCLVGFDLAHAVGNIELQLHDWGVDFAVWCTYKYLNAGPGSVGGCFVHERHHAQGPRQRLEGWWGNQAATRFHIAPDRRFDAIPGAQGWQLSSPPILSMAALRASLEIFTEAGMPALRRKSVQLGYYFQHLLDTMLAGHADSLTPRQPRERACQFTLRVHADARVLQQWLIERGVVCDVQSADVIRVTPVPLYNTFSDLHRLATGLAEYVRAHPRQDGHASGALLAA